MTRDEYMSFSSFAYTPEQRMEAHRKYHGQFVNDATIRYVVSSIGADAIKASTDKHMNDIPLAKWDRLTKGLPLAKRHDSVGDYLTLAGGVCIAKEAAQQFKESAN